MKTNKRMQDILLKYHIGANEPYSLDPNLSSILDSGIREVNGAYLFAKLEGSEAEPSSQFMDLTDYEYMVNHIHLEFNLMPQSRKNPRILVRNGVVFADRLRTKLASAFPKIPFRIILSFRSHPILTCVVRFHRIRNNQEPISDNLEDYKSDAMMVVEVPAQMLAASQ